MSKWTHAICVEDFERKIVDDDVDGTKLRDPDPDICCFCGRATTSGLYVREDPTKTPYCQHDKEPELEEEPPKYVVYDAVVDAIDNSSLDTEAKEALITLYVALLGVNTRAF